MITMLLLVYIIYQILINYYKKNINNYKYLYENLSNINGITLFENCSNRETTGWLFIMKITNKSKFIDKMKEYGITTSHVHNRNYLNNCVKEFLIVLPNITELEKELICIPDGRWLENTYLEYIVNKIKEIQI